MQPLVLHRRDPARNMARFYVLSLQPTLFGETGLVRHWGRIGTSGRYRIDLFASADLAAAALGKLAVRKARRGYVSAGA